MSALHPAWYEHEPGKEIDDMALLDNLTICLGRFKALGDLLVAANQDAINKGTLANTGWLLIHTSEEAQQLLDQWHEKEAQS